MKHNIIIRYILFTLFTISIYGCSKKATKLNAEDMELIAILQDVYIANAAATLIQDGDKTLGQQTLLTQALSIHNLDTNQLYQRLENYRKDPERLRIIYDSLVVRLENIPKQ